MLLSLIEAVNRPVVPSAVTYTLRVRGAVMAGTVKKKPLPAAVAAMPSSDAVTAPFGVPSFQENVAPLVLPATGVKVGPTLVAPEMGPVRLVVIVSSAAAA